MSGVLVSDFSIGDVNLDNIMLTMNKAYKGKMSLSLTKMDTTTVPAIAAGSWADNNGGLYKFDSEETISTTDPVTSTTVVDGVVFIVLVPSGSSITAAFTATAPEWSDSKQGFYKNTVGSGNYRYVARCLKATASFTEKFVIEGYYSFITGVHIDEAYIENLTVGNINMYAIGDIELFRLTQTAASGITEYTQEFSLLKPAILYYESEENGSVVDGVLNYQIDFIANYDCLNGIALLPGEYKLYVSRNFSSGAESLTLYRKVGINNNTSAYGDNWIAIATQAPNAVISAIGDYVALKCTYAEGLSILAAADIISI